MGGRALLEFNRFLLSLEQHLSLIAFKDYVLTIKLIALIRSHLKIKILIQNQGGDEF